MVSVRHLFNILQINVESLFSLPANVFVHSKDDYGVACNNQVAEFINLPNRHEFTGLSYRDLAECMGDQYESFESFRQDDLKVIETGQPLLHVVEPTVHGEEKEYHYISNRFPLFNENGDVECILGISFEAPIERTDISSIMMQTLFNQFPFLKQCLRKPKPLSIHQNPSQYNDQNIFLTQREKQVLLLHAKGFRNKEIANQLGISENTAISHANNIRKKLSSKTMSHAITNAVRLNVIQLTSLLY